MNTAFEERIALLLKFHFNDSIKEIKFEEKSRPTEVVLYHGATQTNKRFWGKFSLTDSFSLMDWIEINIDGQYHKFSHEPEMEEPFVRY